LYNNQCYDVVQEAEAPAAAANANSGQITLQAAGGNSGARPAKKLLTLQKH